MNPYQLAQLLVFLHLLAALLPHKITVSTLLSAHEEMKLGEHVTSRSQPWRDNFLGGHSLNLCLMHYRPNT